MTTPFVDFQKQVIDEFRAHHGRVGGMFEGARLVLLTTTGARTGRPHTTPAGFLPDPDRLLVIASAGGAQRNPAWFHNLVAHPRVTVETGPFTLEADAVVLEGAERDEVWARAVASDPGWAEYQRKTTRTIPVIALHPVRTTHVNLPEDELPGHLDERGLAPLWTTLKNKENRLTTHRVTGPDTYDTLSAALSGVFGGPPPLPSDANTAEPFTLPVPGRWVDASGRTPQEAGVLLYAHGGGFEHTLPDYEQAMAYHLAKAAGRPAFGLAYSLAPEHTFPVAHDELVSAYRALLAEGVPAERTIFFGESAGATLVLEALHTLRAEGVPLPGAVVPVSPVTDFTATNASIDAPAGRDGLSRKVLEHVVTQYLGGLPNDRAPQSPIHGDLAGLPRMLVVVGGNEALLDDSRLYAEAAAGAGVEVTLDVYEDMPHAFELAILAEPRPAVATTFLDRLTAWL
ncbi:nitroreductase/quinone reductase family protein [Actinomadura oligospora]|uniref:nitroreductase/quinone reductase family protein n=1 Tax=Actinomadura oligospora TaxID=111804 RepID=UPI0004B9577B|nr:nitroreductase/quinone reductase family protein [Actinomadura oligospora]